jgi:hypothetical protein
MMLDGIPPGTGKLKSCRFLFADGFLPRFPCDACESPEALSPVVLVRFDFEIF